jgi:hypothetical protein
VFLTEGRQNHDAFLTAYWWQDHLQFSGQSPGLPRFDRLKGAISHRVERQTGWSIKEFVQTTQRYRVVAILGAAGDRLIAR